MNKQDLTKGQIKSIAEFVKKLNSFPTTHVIPPMKRGKNGKWTPSRPRESQLGRESRRTLRALVY